eukprot:Skav226820  [mRNA]  locus=scaffold606:105615:110960:- [translate_table: standard]
MASHWMSLGRRALPLAQRGFCVAAGAAAISLVATSKRRHGAVTLRCELRTLYPEVEARRTGRSQAIPVARWLCSSMGDIEQLRTHLGIERWDLVVGGSWGSALALAYATKYPYMVKAMASINFVYSPEGSAQFFPEEYETFVKALPMKERNDIIGSYAKRLDSEDPKVKLAATSAYLRWVLHLLSVSPDKEIIEEIAQKPEEAGPGPAIEMNYMARLGDGKGWSIQISCFVLSIKVFRGFNRWWKLISRDL